MNYFHGRESGFWQQPVTGCLWLALVFMWGGALRGGGGRLIAIFQGGFATIGEMFNLAGRLGAGLTFHGV